MKTILRKSLATFGFELRRIPSRKGGPVAVWDEEGEFDGFHRQVIGRTVVNKQRCFIIYQLANHIAGLPGDVAEVGVYRGGTARLLAKTLAATRKPIHLFDTFEGMPQTDPMRDTLRKGDFGETSFEDVKNYLRDCRDVRLYPGLFPETATPIQDSSFCLAHVDVDIYRSVLDCCEFFYPRLERGGVMIFDDYGDKSCPGARMAVDEFFSEKRETPCYLPTGQCIVVRL